SRAVIRQRPYTDSRETGTHTLGSLIGTVIGPIGSGRSARPFAISRRWSGVIESHVECQWATRPGSPGRQLVVSCPRAARVRLVPTPRRRRNVLARNMSDRGGSREGD